MPPLTIFESRRADGNEGICQACGNPIEPGQRIVLTHDGAKHAWLHFRDLILKGRRT